MDFLKMLTGQLTNNNQTEQLTQQLNGASNEQTQKATEGIFSSFIGALSKNSQDPAKAEQLNNALERDHDGSVLGNLTSMFGGKMPDLSSLASNLPFGGNNNNEQSTSNASERTMNGGGILKHVFGDKQEQVAQNVSQSSGMSTENVTSLMSRLAPMVMGMLGQQKKEQGLDAQGVANMLQGQSENLKKSGQASGLLGFLDSDGDGDVDMGDITGFVKKLF